MRHIKKASPSPLDQAARWVARLCVREHIPSGAAALARSGAVVEPSGASLILLGSPGGR